MGVSNLPFSRLATFLRNDAEDSAPSACSTSSIVVTLVSVPMKKARPTPATDRQSRPGAIFRPPGTHRTETGSTRRRWFHARLAGMAAL